MSGPAASPKADVASGTRPMAEQSVLTADTQKLPVPSSLCVRVCASDSHVFPGCRHRLRDRLAPVLSTLAPVAQLPPPFEQPRPSSIMADFKLSATLRGHEDDVSPA